MSTRSTIEQSPTLLILSRTVLILSVVIISVPILFTIMTSLKSPREFYANIWLPARDPQWRNYAEAWVLGNIGTYLTNSLIVVTGTVVLTGFVALLGGYALAKLDIPRAETVMIVFMTFTFLPQVAIYVPLYIQMSKMGLLDSYLTLIIPYTAWQIPFSMYIFKKFFETVPSELIESARMDGSREHQTFYVIVVPLVKPAIATVGVLNFIIYWGELMWASITMAASARYRTIPIGLLLFKTDMGIEWGRFAAGITIVTVPLITLFMFVQKYFIQGLTTGAVKG